MRRGSRLPFAVMRFMVQKVIDYIAKINVRFRTVLICFAIFYLASQLWGLGHKDVNGKSLRLFNQMHNHLWYRACKGILLVQGNIGDDEIVIQDGQHRSIDLQKVTGIPVIGEVTGNYDMYAMSTNDIVSTNLIRYKVMISMINLNSSAIVKMAKLRKDVCFAAMGIWVCSRDH